MSPSCSMASAIFRRSAAASPRCSVIERLLHIQFFAFLRSPSGSGLLQKPQARLYSWNENPLTDN